MAYASLTEINRGWQLDRLLLIQHSQAWTKTMTTREDTDMMFDTHWPTSPVFFSSSVSQWKYFVFGSSCNERQLWAHTRQHMFHQTGRKGSAHVDIDALGKYTYTHTHTAWGCTTAAGFKVRVQPGGKFPGGSPNIPKAPSYCCSAHPSVGQVGLYCRLSCVCMCIFLRDRQEVRSSDINGCCHDSMALPFEFLTAR